MPQKSARPAAVAGGARPASKGRVAKGAPATARKGRNEVRIIGGEWRGRRVAFAPVPALRPTPDRVRETLFNWLQPVVYGSRCLDLFAGSGALGLEALSRGAREVVFVEKERTVIASLRAALIRLGSEPSQVKQADARQFLAGPAQPFDIVFLDPPFESRWLPEVCEALEQRGWLAPHATIYVEMPATEPVPRLPPGWNLLRSKRAGEVGYHLARRGEPD
jgi:16S rRNA (guanine966-N2)-methyltransferase